MSFSGMTILFTGKLKNMKREDAEAKVVSLGGKVASGVLPSINGNESTSSTDLCTDMPTIQNHRQLFSFIPVQLTHKPK
ncbi:MAG: hypothetical protein IJU23_00875 [Proteobacteria bacterium]|nr:hypothetical protein [Pseudomonadota bacterium]